VGDMRKNRVTKLLLVLMLAFGISYLTFGYLEGMNKTITIYVATEHIEARTIITEDMVRGIEIGYREKLQFFEEAYTLKEEIVGLVSLRNIQKEEVIYKDIKILASTEQVNVLKKTGEINDPFFISYDKRLTNIKIDEIDAVGGKVHKGDYVDIVFTSTSGSTGGLYSALILQHVLVYEIVKEDTDYKIYFVLTPEDALDLVLAQKTGSLSLLLNPLKGEVKKITPAVPDRFYDGLFYEEGEAVNELEKEEAEGEEAVKNE